MSAVRVGFSLVIHKITKTEPNHTARQTNHHRRFTLHNFLSGLLALGVDWFARGIMRTGSLLLTRRAKLDALSSAIRWIMRQQNNQPLQISHDTPYGDLTLMSDGELIQLTWRLIDNRPLRSTTTKSCEVPCEEPPDQPSGRQTHTLP